MAKIGNPGDNTTQPPTKSTVVFLLGTMADTTWRMFVPIIGLTLLGLYIDKQLHTVPWLMIVGIIGGVVIAGLLIRNQIKKGTSR
jgi:hypothetical protein